MRIVTAGRGVERAVLAWQKKGLKVGFVPTMGALHEGHVALIRRARRDNDKVVVSIFVNPTQFNQAADLKRYPRPFKKDAAACRAAGVDLLFHPSVKGMYPDGFQTRIVVGDVAKRWEGETRPGHFEGVATVVHKLFMAALPNRAYFGEKDYQQLQVVKRMVRDLGLPVTVVGVPTSREASGLARSSRNVFLAPKQRETASLLALALREGKALARAGKTPARVLAAARAVLRGEGALRVEYLAFVDPESLEPLKRPLRDGRLLVAAWIGGTRLIDNL